MNTSLTCPTCAFDLADAPFATAAATSTGPVRYLRCVCGQWSVVQAGELIAIAGSSAFADSH